MWIKMGDYTEEIKKSIMGEKKFVKNLRGSREFKLGQLQIRRFTDIIKNKNTLQSYQHTLEAFLVFLLNKNEMHQTKKDMDNFETSDIEAFIATYTREEKDDMYVRKIIRIVTEYCEFIGLGDVLKNAKLPKLKSVKLTEVKEPISKEIIEEIENELKRQKQGSKTYEAKMRSYRAHAIFRLSLLCGIRTYEFEGIKKKDIDFLDQTIEVESKAKKRRKIPLLLEAATALLDYIQLLDVEENDYIFVNSKGEPISFITVQRALTFDNINIKVTNNDLIHTFVYNLAFHTKLNRSTIKEISGSYHMVDAYMKEKRKQDKKNKKKALSSEEILEELKSAVK